jgi:FecR protein
MHNRWIVTAAALLVCFALPAHAQQKIGKATSVKPQAQGSVAGQLAPDSDVHANETVRTSTGGQAELLFVDRTKMSVGPMSTVRLDKFAYDPNRGTGTVVVNATRGAYRFITGVQDPRSYEIKTRMRHLACAARSWSSSSKSQFGLVKDNEPAEQVRVNKDPGLPLVRDEPFALVDMFACSSCPSSGSRTSGDVTVHFINGRSLQAKLKRRSGFMGVSLRPLGGPTTAK